MSYNINDICRVCLAPTTSRKNSNLFFSAGRSVQLWAKVMACAWVQVFEGDGLPSQICYKCHNKLDIAYQFKQQCEAADAHIRQLLNRNVPEKNPAVNIDLTQNQNEYTGECKPLNFNITSECLDLVQQDLSLSSYRLNQDIASPQHIDFRLREIDFAGMKEEPGFAMNLNVFNNLNLPKNDCQVNSSFKCESFNENDIILDNLPAKLIETVNETISQAPIELTGHGEPKLPSWDIPQRDHTTLLLSSKNDFIFNSEDKENSTNRENSCKETEPDISFLSDDHVASAIAEKNMLPDVCSDSSAMDIENDCDFSQIHEEPLPVENPVTESIVNELNCEKTVEPVIEMKKVRKKKQSQSKKQDKVDENGDPIQKPAKKDCQEQCELCGKVFKYRYILQHLRTHTGDRPFTCSHCGQKFTLYKTLVTHMRIHSGDKPYICTVCGKGFTQSAGLKSHMRAHTGEKPYQCEICAKTFSQKCNLLMHKQIHSGQRDHVCSICQTAFKLYKHLHSHMTLHSGRKEFKCSICDKSFHRKHYLNIHMSVHSGEKPFKCNVCGNGFSNSSNLRAHTRIHTGIKPYKCKVCKKAFSQSSALNRHMQQHSTTLPSNNVN